VDKLEAACAVYSKRSELDEVVWRPAFIAAKAEAPPNVRRDIDAILAAAYERLPATPIENDPMIGGDELPEVEIAGADRVMPALTRCTLLALGCTAGVVSRVADAVVRDAEATTNGKQLNNPFTLRRSAYQRHEGDHLRPPAPDVKQALMRIAKMTTAAFGLRQDPRLYSDWVRRLPVNPRRRKEPPVSDRLALSTPSRTPA
jgi:hypothetical protein